MALDWDPPRVMCTAFVGATYSEDLACSIEGWVCVDQYDDRCVVFAEMLQCLRKKHGGAELLPNSATSCGYDIRCVLALGLRRMRIAADRVS